MKINHCEAGSSSPSHQLPSTQGPIIILQSLPLTHLTRTLYILNISSSAPCPIPLTTALGQALVLSCNIKITSLSYTSTSIKHDGISWAFLSFFFFLNLPIAAAGSPFSKAEVGLEPARAEPLEGLEPPSTCGLEPSVPAGSGSAQRSPDSCSQE